MSRRVYNIPMRSLIILFFLLSFLAGCGKVSRESSRPQVQVDLEKNARLLMQSADYSSAATEYLRLATTNKQNAATYRLQAATAYFEAGLYKDAEKILNDTAILADDVPQAIHRQILRVQLKLALDQPGEAVTSLNKISEQQIPQTLKRRYHDISAIAYLAYGDYLKAINERIKLQHYLNTPAKIDQNNHAIWGIFETIPRADLDDLRLVAPAELISWFELASLYRSYRFQPDKLKNAINGWSQRYPEHQASRAIVSELIDRSVQFVGKPTKIGLLLPFSGQYQKVSTAIRDGFLAARYLDSGEKPVVEIYDTNALSIIETYQQAVRDGVDYVVGPLEKAALNNLIEYGELQVQVLALNRQAISVEQNWDKKLLQFGLLPEDEAVAVAETAISDSHTLALIVTPDIPWGERMADAFKKRWIELGGGVLEHVRFTTTDSRDFSTPVKELLNIDSSEQRGRALRNKLNRKIHIVERRRQDADFIFTAIVPKDARQLLPQLRFQRAGDLPVYSTSHIFTGIVDVAKDADLEGAMFIDMPWLLDTTRQLSIIQDALNRHWSQDKSNYRRFYAFGIDAYRLIPRIRQLRAEKNSFLNGETGDLFITPDNIIKRKLHRAQFVGGQPVLLH